MSISRLANGVTHRDVKPMSMAEVRAFRADRDGAVVEATEAPRPDGWPNSGCWPWPIPTHYECGCPVPARYSTPEYIAGLLAQLDKHHADEHAAEVGLDRTLWPRRPLPRSRDEIADTHYDPFEAEFGHIMDSPRCHPRRLGRG